MVYGKKKLEDSKLFKKSRSMISLPEGNKSEHFGVFTTRPCSPHVYIYIFQTHIHYIRIYT